MNKPVTPAGLRQRTIEDVNVRGFSAKTPHDYLRVVNSRTVSRPSRLALRAPP